MTLMVLIYLLQVEGSLCGTSDKGQPITISGLSVPVISQPAASIGSSNDSSQSGIERKEWGRQIEFILTLVGFCVGLGNVWRFPYLCYQNGGGAFLIPYFITLVLVGIPLYYLELILGQFSSLGPTAVWMVEPMFKGVGISMVIIVAYIVCYYNVITAWAMFYLFASMTSELPWKYCNNWWNTKTCIDSTMNITEIVENGTINGSKPTTPSDGNTRYYCFPNYAIKLNIRLFNFSNNVLRMSEGIEYPGSVVWQLCLLLFLAWLIICLVLMKGVDSVGKAAYFVSLFPYVLLTILLGQAATLDGAKDGIKFYMYPEWDRLADAQTWSEAATQIFYSLGICMGSLIAMSSYNNFRYNCQRDSVMIPLINCLTSIYAGFVVFAMLGYIAKEKNLEIKDVAKEGPGLVFVVYPEGLATLPVAPLWSTLFFFMMSTLGFSSQFSMAEGVCVAIEDEFDFLRKGRNGLLLRFAYCFANFLLGIPMVIEGVLIFKCLYESPLTFGDYVFPGWANAIAWLIVALPLSCIVGYMVYYHMRYGGAGLCKENSKSTPEWGPALKVNRTGRYQRVIRLKRNESCNLDNTIPETTPLDKKPINNGLFTVSNSELGHTDCPNPPIISADDDDDDEEELRMTSAMYTNQTYEPDEFQRDLTSTESREKETFSDLRTVDLLPLLSSSKSAVVHGAWLLFTCMTVLTWFSGIDS
ncbi:hypothetical protein LSH36_5g10015 [Paralvinella palmiformis]|uniref:Transporter n=1 Tax=Paralvinella palmiformis TaxID=53620 RepID=A0AAD9KGB2_9ANNE|nr:hypothetical protein LSH36_5g10015 [Paralvinella palmiformis]